MIMIIIKRNVSYTSKVLGNIVRHSFASRKPLCTLPHSMQALRQISSQVKDGWDEKCHIWNAALASEIHALAKNIVGCFHLPCCSEEFITSFSDASHSEQYTLWAYYAGRETIAGEFLFDEHIFLLELRSALFAILQTALTHPNSHIVHMTDNTPTMFAIRNGHSGLDKGDTLLNFFYNSLPRTTTFQTIHIPTHLCPVDAFTKGAIPDVFVTRDVIRAASSEHSYQGTDDERARQGIHDCDTWHEFEVASTCP